MNNHKKEYPENGLEVDATGYFGRKYCTYINNIRGIRKFVKRQMNKRFRRFNRNINNFDT